MVVNILRNAPATDRHAGGLGKIDAGQGASSGDASSAVSSFSGARMARALNIVCPHCDTINRVPREWLRERAKCGSCHRPLYEGRPAALNSAAWFDKHAKHGDVLLLVDFWSAWCGPCRAMAPIFEQAATELEPDVRLVKVDSDAVPDLLQRFSIQSIPTLRPRVLTRLPGRPVRHLPWSGNGQTRCQSRRVAPNHQNFRREQREQQRSASARLHTNSDDCRLIGAHRRDEDQFFCYLRKSEESDSRQLESGGWAATSRLRRQTHDRRGATEQATHHPRHERGEVRAVLPDRGQSPCR
jgi:thioredoxin 2